MNPAHARRSSSDRFHFELGLRRDGVQSIAGVDEAGRGPLAGPVVAAAARFAPEILEAGLPDDLAGLNDSKQLSAAQRSEFFSRLLAFAPFQWSVAWVDAPEIDRLNILRATHTAMIEAVRKLAPPPAHVLVDGRPVPGFPWPQTAIVKGDALSYSIAAASILAKVTRDRMMDDYHQAYPQYGFDRHRGYGTPEHLAAISRHGPCPIHRRSFAPLKPIPADLFPDAGPGISPVNPTASA